MGTHPIFESDFDCLTESTKEIEMADIDIFGDDPVVPEEKKEAEENEIVEKSEAEEKSNEVESEKEDENKEMEHENGTEEKMVEDGGVIDDEKMVQDGGTIEDEPAVIKAVVPAKKEFVPYVSKTDTIQVSNVTCKATEEQMSVLFSFVGPIIRIEMFPKNPDEMVKNKVAFIKFTNKEDIIVALHLTHTVFIDSALQVTEWTDDWPDQSEALIYCTPKSAVETLNLGAGIDATSAAITLFNNPRLMTTTNQKTADEFRRQVCIGNVHEVVIEEQVQQYFESYAGSVERVEFHELRKGKDTQMDKDDLGHQVRYCTIVFKDSSSLGPALQLDGQMFAGIPITVKHTKYSDIQHDSGPKSAAKLASDYSSKRRSRTRSRSRDRSSSRRRRRSRSRSRDRSRRRSRSRKRRSRSRDRKRRSRSRSKKSKSKKSRR